MYEITKIGEYGKRRSVQVSITAGVILVIVLIAFLSGRKGSSYFPGDATNGFTFFSIGPETLLTDPLREELRRRLGPDVMERWSDIDLSVNHDGFLEKYFPQLELLNRKLKNEIPRDTEKNPIKLIFRHTRDKETPFSYVELVFSHYTRKPLMLKIRPKTHTEALLNALEEKYGRPEIIQWEDDRPGIRTEGTSFYWREEGDLLILTRTPDRYGDPEYHLRIYYLENLEKTFEIKQSQETREKPGEKVKNAF